MKAYRVIAPQVLAVHHVDDVFAGLPVGVSGVQHASLGLYTGRTHQFVAYFNAERELCVAGRRLGSNNWTRKPLPERLEWDSHNYVSLGLDAGGYIHLCGNMHGAPLCYFRSVEPYEVRNLKRVRSMSGQDETQVTYPRFLRAKGVLYFIYRDGVSGAGNQIYNVYDHKTGIWKRLHESPLTDGEGLSSAYFEGPVLGPDGRFHLCWMWRDAGDALTNHSLCYARSHDLRNWESSKGRPLSLPITSAKAEVVDPAEPGEGLINGDHRIGFDRQGRVIITYHRYDEEGNSQLYQARLEERGWAIYKSTAWNYRWGFGGFGSLAFEITFGPVVIDSHGRLVQWYRHVAYGEGTFVLDEVSLRPVGVAEGRFDLPSTLMAPESSFPGMEVNWATDLGPGPDGGSRYVLRWEALPANRDQTREGPLPEPTPLRVYKLSPGGLGERADEALPQVAVKPGFPEPHPEQAGEHAQSPPRSEGAVRNLVSKLEAQKARADALTSKFRAQQSVVEGYEQSLEQAERSVAALEVQVADADGHLADLIARVEDLDRSITQRDQHIKSLHQTITDRVRYINAIDRELAEHRAQVTELKSQVQRLESSLASASAELKDRHNRLGKRDEELKAVCQQEARLRSQLGAVYASRSWRITKPLRILSRVLRGRWILRNTRRALKLLGWVATGQFGRAGRALLLYIHRYLPRRFRTLIPRRLRQSIRRWLGFPDERSNPPVSPQVVIRSTRVQDLSDDVWWKEFIMPRMQVFPHPDGCTGSPSPSSDIARRLGQAQNALSVVIPVFNAPHEAEQCLASVLRYTSEDCRIIVIDDGSTDSRVHHLLSKYTTSGRVEVCTHETNLGYSRSVNRGIQLADRSDVVLLNADTVVPPGWLRNLRLAAYSGEKVGTATALSNDAGAFSVPTPNHSNPIPPGLGIEEYGRAILQASARTYPEAPTGNGFCMYIRRDCLDETGLLDAQAFPKGYGEENDFCMRARSLGWTHVVDDATLVYHVNAASFGKEAKADLLKRGRAVIDERYPEYSGAVSEFMQSPRMRAVRARVREVNERIRPDRHKVRPRVLYVLSTNTGGTPHTNQDLMTALQDRLETFVLTCDRRSMRIMYFAGDRYVELEHHQLSEPICPFPHRSREYDQVISEWLVRYAIELLHVRHIAWHSLGVVEVAKSIGLPVVFSFHDYYSICPTVRLLDERDLHCAGRCTPTSGDCRVDLWPNEEFRSLKDGGIHRWQSQMAAMLSQTDAYVTTSQAAKALLIGAYPFLSTRVFTVIAHGRDFAELGRDFCSLAPDEPVRILVPGNIDRAKGGKILVDLIKHSRTHRFEIHILGRVMREVYDSVMGSEAVTLHGEYRREEFLEKARLIRPHIGAVLSIWPETYCHTLTELWAAGVPAIGFDLGAVGERIRATDAGWLAPEPTVEGVLHIIDTLRADPEELARKAAAVLAWQHKAAATGNCKQMADAYFDLYLRLNPGLEPMCSTTSSLYQREQGRFEMPY